jgi:hypothetical protein
VQVADLGLVTSLQEMGVRKPFSFRELQTHAFEKLRLQMKKAPVGAL